MFVLKFPLIIGIGVYFITGLLLLILKQFIWKFTIHKIWHHRHQNCLYSSFPPTQQNIFNLFILRIEDFINLRFNKGIFKKIFLLWQDSGLGKKNLSFLFFSGLLISVIILFGSMTQLNLFLLILIGGIIFLIFYYIIYIQAQKKRNRFYEQFPILLDQLSDSLTAGLSFRQAVEFVIPNLPQPSSSEMAHIYNQLILGFPINDVLKNLNFRYSSDNIRLFIEGITVQQLAGGDMAEMMRKMAITARERENLRNEILLLTAQGRLTAIVIALLIPLSLGLLSLLPGYSEILFTTKSGNLILFIIAFLELMGTLIVIRLVRPEPH